MSQTTKLKEKFSSKELQLTQAQNALNRIVHDTERQFCFSGCCDCLLLYSQVLFTFRWCSLAIFWANSRAQFEIVIPSFYLDKACGGISSSRCNSFKIHNFDCNIIGNLPNRIFSRRTTSTSFSSFSMFPRIITISISTS